MFTLLRTLTGTGFQPDPAAVKGFGQTSILSCGKACSPKRARMRALRQPDDPRSNERKIMKRTSAVAALAVIALAAAGCSSSGSSSTSSGSSSGGGGTIDFYSSLPMQGASSAQTGPLVNGIKLALAQANNKAGQWTVNYQVLDDSTAAAGKWDPGQTAANARKVASDPKAVY
jgi:hypothetical protein